MKLRTLINFLNDFNKTGEHNDLDIFVAIDANTTYPVQSACVARVRSMQDDLQQCLVITSLTAKELQEGGRVNEETEIIRPELDS